MLKRLLIFLSVGGLALLLAQGVSGGMVTAGPADGQAVSPPQTKQLQRKQGQEKKKESTDKKKRSAEELLKQREAERIRQQMREKRAAKREGVQEQPKTEQKAKAGQQPVEKKGQPDGDQQKKEAPPATPPAAAKPAAQTTPPAATTSTDQGVRLDYEDANLTDFINVVSGILNLNYILDPAVKGTVNIKMTRPVPKEALLPIFIDILRINGATIVKSGELYHIVPIDAGKTYPSEDITTASPDTRFEGSDLSTLIIPVQFMPSADLAKILDEFKTDRTQIINYESNNILIITDFKDNLNKLFDIVKILDNGYFTVNKIELIPIKYNKAEDVSKDLEAVFSAGGTASGVKLVPIPRLNGILAVCRSEGALKTVQEWVDKLDRQAVHGVETFVYKVANTTATNISDILAQLFGDMGAQTATVGAARPVSTTEGGGTTGGLMPSSTTGGGNTITPQLRGTLKGSEGGPIQGLSGNVKIITDELNNSLIIQGTQADYEFLLKTIKKLDVLPRQVLIEAKILSVTLNDSLNFGVSATLQKRADYEYRPTTGSMNNEGLNLSSFATFGLSGRREVAMLLNTLETMSTVRVLENPTVMVMDGTEASIRVGSEIPIASGTYGFPNAGGTSQDGSFYNYTNTQIQYRQTGITLTVAPRISSSGIVTMELVVEVTKPGTTSSLANSPSIDGSNLQSTMVVKDGASVVIAGIIRENDTKGRDGVPILSKVPILGWLFGSTNKSKRREELLVILTPHVVQTVEDAATTTNDIVGSLKHINQYIKEQKEKGDYGFFSKTDDTPKKPLPEAQPKADTDVKEGAKTDSSKSEKKTSKTKEKK